MKQYKDGHTYTTKCGCGRITYCPNWSSVRPWCSYINGTAGGQFATPEEACKYFLTHKMTLIIKD